MGCMGGTYLTNHGQFSYNPVPFYSSVRLRARRIRAPGAVAHRMPLQCAHTGLRPMGLAPVKRGWDILQDAVHHPGRQTPVLRGGTPPTPRPGQGPAAVLTRVCAVQVLEQCQ